MRDVGMESEMGMAIWAQRFGVVLLFWEEV